MCGIDKTFCARRVQVLVLRSMYIDYVLRSCLMISVTSFNCYWFILIAHKHSFNSLWKWKHKIRLSAESNMLLATVNTQQLFLFITWRLKSTDTKETSGTSLSKFKSGSITINHSSSERKACEHFGTNCLKCNWPKVNTVRSNEVHRLRKQLVVSCSVFVYSNAFSSTSPFG